MKILVSCSAKKVVRVFIHSWYVLAQSLVKTFPKWILFLFSSGILLFKLIETISYFSKTSILTQIKHPFPWGFILLANLIVVCQSKGKATT